MKYGLNFITAYSQFYIKDKNSRGGASWEGSAYEDRLDTTNDVVAIRIETYGAVHGELIILTQENREINLDLYDHIVEGSIEINSGILQITDCPSNTIIKEINVEPGIYRVRVYSANLNSVVDEDTGDDHYKIEIWQGTLANTTVIKIHLRENGE